jgi:hypothetical protein
MDAGNEFQGVAGTSTQNGEPPAVPERAPAPRAGAQKRKKPILDRIEAFLSRLSTRNNFWHRIFSLIWLPFAFRSGIKMKRIDRRTFTAVLPFRRFNRNWYNAMAGAALLGNSEIAGGMYVFGVCGGDYTVVCKHLEYKFLRPCFGPAVYRINPREDIEGLIAGGGEFNITIDLDIAQQIVKPGDKEKRVGRCTAMFHATPKSHQKNRQTAREKRTPAAKSREGAPGPDPETEIVVPVTQQPQDSPQQVG